MREMEQSVWCPDLNVKRACTYEEASGMGT